MNLRTPTRTRFAVSPFEFSNKLHTVASQELRRAGLRLAEECDHEWQVRIHEAVVRMAREDRISSSDDLAEAERATIAFAHELVAIASEDRSPMITLPMFEAGWRICPIWPFC